MLRNLLKQILPAPRAQTPVPGRAQTSPPLDATIPEPGGLEHFLWLAGPHKQAPLDLHLQILFEGVQVGDRDFLALMRQAMKETSSRVPGVKVLRRNISAWYLARYFSRARTVPGAWAECGVYTGTSALTLCLAARAEVPAFDGTGMHLIDSFEGLSTPVESDSLREPVRDAILQSRSPPIAAGTLSAPIEVAIRALREFPGVRIVKGWIPQAFAQLPETEWSFVHLDVDLHEPTLDSLRYFEPRLAPGGVIICDDYGALTFPGAARAWDLYFSDPQKPFVVLPTGQSVYVRA